MDLGLKGKRALVLGASQGLGRAIATELAQEGADVALMARREDVLQQVKTELDALSGGGRIMVAQADLADEASVKTAYQAVQGSFGGVDILVLVSGGPPPGGAEAPSSEVWRQQYELLMLAPMALVKMALPGMKANHWGRIITVASSGIVQPIPRLSISNTLRSGFVAWSKTLASDVAADGITANVIVPGRIATDRVAQLDQGNATRSGITVDEVKAQSRAKIPMGRYGEPREFAAMAAFLVSERASYVTGSIVRVDGGLITAI
ncbi:SDR family oxidoreductase [Komagataeibacter xylinus]|uniref:SDR family oxidoreductase n=1 Tax=Komagataeibacter xylinus TaxID=28448 RepID=A0A857FN65_KOMXY|nr:SDR family oxidoreductase [Komagataeibacter xylinus]QHC35605.1 SDR family oxidoreductase [Komagataeibacter xylinus]